MKKVKKVAAIVAFSFCLVSGLNSPAVAGIIGNDSMNTSQISGYQQDPGLWGLAFSVSPQFANLLVRMGLI